jgi:hypothetical protein
MPASLSPMPGSRKTIGSSLEDLASSMSAIAHFLLDVLGYNENRMRKIKVLEFSNQWSMGGTEKTAQLLVKHLTKDRFEVYAAGWKGGPRLPSRKGTGQGVVQRQRHRPAD